MGDSPPVMWKTREFILRTFEGQSVVFHIDSADTHLLNPTAARVLQRLKSNPASMTVLAEELALAHDLEPDQELLQHVEGLLANLYELGLIEPIT